MVHSNKIISLILINLLTANSIKLEEGIINEVTLPDNQPTPILASNQEIPSSINSLNSPFIANSTNKIEIQPISLNVNDQSKVELPLNNNINNLPDPNKQNENNNNNNNNNNINNINPNIQDNILNNDIISSNSSNSFEINNNNNNNNNMNSSIMNTNEINKAMNNNIENSITDNNVKEFSTNEANTQNNLSDSKLLAQTENFKLDTQFTNNSNESITSNILNKQENIKSIEANNSTNLQSKEPINNDLNNNMKSNNNLQSNQSNILSETSKEGLNNQFNNVPNMNIIPNSNQVTQENEIKELNDAELNDVAKQDLQLNSNPSSNNKQGFNINTPIDKGTKDLTNKDDIINIDLINKEDKSKNVETLNKKSNKELNKQENKQEKEEDIVQQDKENQLNKTFNIMNFNLNPNNNPDSQLIEKWLSQDMKQEQDINQLRQNDVRLSKNIDELKLNDMIQPMDFDKDALFSPKLNSPSSLMSPPLTLSSKQFNSPMPGRSLPAQAPVPPTFFAPEPNLESNSNPLINNMAQIKGQSIDQINLSNIKSSIPIPNENNSFGNRVKIPFNNNNNKIFNFETSIQPNSNNINDKDSVINTFNNESINEQFDTLIPNLNFDKLSFDDKNISNNPIVSTKFTNNNANNNVNNVNDKIDQTKINFIKPIGESNQSNINILSQSNSNSLIQKTTPTITLVKTSVKTQTIFKTEMTTLTTITTQTTTIQKTELVKETITVHKVMPTAWNYNSIDDIQKFNQVQQNIDNINSIRMSLGEEPKTVVFMDKPLL